MFNELSCRGVVTPKGTEWKLKAGAAYLVFPPHAVYQPTFISVYKWTNSTRSPPLQGYEAIVSNVIEISADSYVPFEDLPFDGEVTLFLWHSAADLQGHELVLKRLVDDEDNEWEDVGGTQALENCYGWKIHFLCVC